MVERIIGIDFGTSTSVIRVRRYENENPIDDPKAVTFNNGSTLVPTLIRKLANGQSAYFGYDASVPKRSTTLFRNFKLNIDDPDDDKREFAKELTSEYLKYLGDSYHHQSETGFLGANDDQVKTYISYPVKWSREAQEFMVKATEDAGFPNVEGLDEAQACIKAVTEQFADMLTKKGYFKPGTTSTILLIDMGAGTTDLVLCRHSPGINKKTEILSTWPKGSEELFGGHVIDDILYNYIISSFPNEQAVGRIPLSAFKTWKESTVSPALAKGEAVDYFDALEQIEMFMGIDLSFEAIDRDRFEELTGDYLQLLPKMISDILTDAKIQPDDVDLVIITGGHSQWYFVREILTDAMKQFGSIGLDKIKADPDRIISLERPQETVALGLVYLQSNPVYEELENEEPDHEEKSNDENTCENYRLILNDHLHSPRQYERCYVSKSVGETTKYLLAYVNREKKSISISDQKYASNALFFESDKLVVHREYNDQGLLINIKKESLIKDTPSQNKEKETTLIRIKPKIPDCTHKGNKEYWFRVSDNVFFLDEEGSISVPYFDVEIPALGHTFEWKTDENGRYMQCARCGYIKNAFETNEEIPTGIEQPIVNEKKEHASPDIKQPIVYDKQEQEINETVEEETFHASENDFVLGSFGDGYVITKYLAKNEIVVVPKSIRGKQVVAIGDNAFVNSKITYLELPDSVVNIGKRAFMNCSNLKEVKMHDGIKSIDDYAFFNCTKLEILDFSNGNTVPKVAHFPKGLLRIGLCAFTRKDGLIRPNGAILRDVTINKKTRIGSILYSRNINLFNTFGKCAVFYY